MTLDRQSVGACGKCGGRRVEWFFGLRVCPWCPDCRTQLDGFPYRVVYDEVRS